MTPKQSVMGIVPGQGPVNCLAHGPCGSKWNTHVWEEGEGPPLWSAPPDPV
jgi:hypothetical protein